MPGGLRTEEGLAGGSFKSVNETVGQSGRHTAVAVRAWPKRMPDGRHKGTRRMGYG